MTNEELCKALRKPWFTNGCEKYQLEAADQIEALVKERGEWHILWREALTAGYAMKDRAEAAEAALKAVDPAAIREAALREAADVSIPYFDEDGELHHQKLSFRQKNSILALIDKKEVA